VPPGGSSGSCGRNCGCWTRCTSTPTRSKIARSQKAHVLFKFKEADFRQVTQDAQNLFKHFGGDEEQRGWDSARQCRWKLRKTTDAFAGYPVQVVELNEYYPKKKRERNVSCWIVSTDVDLPLEEVREAAHQRWQIENTTQRYFLI